MKQLYHDNNWEPFLSEFIELKEVIFHENLCVLSLPCNKIIAITLDNTYLPKMFYKIYSTNLQKYCTFKIFYKLVIKMRWKTFHYDQETFKK